MEVYIARLLIIKAVLSVLVLMTNKTSSQKSLIISQGIKLATIIMGFNIEHAKPLIEKVPIITRCWEKNHLVVSKQRDGEVILQVSLYRKKLK